MKILILMPLDEKGVYMATGLYKALTAKAKEVTFAMPQYMEYLMDTKIINGGGTAVFDAIVAAKNVYNAAGDRDLIIIGNIPKDYKFDAVFNFQDEEQSCRYEDLFVEKLKEICASEELLMKYLNNLYTDEDSKLGLTNINAAADFISTYLDTDPHLDEITQKYREKLEHKPWLK